ncbi:DUF2523 family protein [Diaphorobacter caeni]|uniref:DUF2523 family protein n=1 Tax=Diaphorobacter caeni TaxID=2784387 RepID=UPI00188F7D98|nr:DUF2523 family protein [Diaphorobacter caeni]MBF5006636.1 DUF2523 domain-containing protein [Diaphorobacter caeni]
MQTLLDWLKTAFDKLFSWFGDIFVAIFKAAWDFLGDGVCWVLEQLLGVAVSAANALDLSGLQGHASDWSIMPPEIVNVMQLSGLSVAVPIVVAAIGIRLILQLIPFTRLGS